MTEPSRPDLPRLIEHLRESGFIVPVKSPGIEWFGDSAELASELCDLVRRGVKRASAGLLASWQADGDVLPRIGDVKIIIDWKGEPIAVIEVTEARILPFEEVDEAFASDEGEGDQSLAWWREAHWRYFLRECARLGCQLTKTMPVVCWRFRLLQAVGEPA
jgi:uncharacterized protein YhfF